MEWLEKIRNKPHEEKIRLICVTVAISAIVLIGLWIATSKIRKNIDKDTTLFEAINQGIKDVKKNYGK